MEISYNREQNALSILEELNGFRETRQHCDFVIEVGTEEFHVHQNVLCANSKYFKAMLSHDTAEKQTGRVELKDMNANCVQICADFMYCQFVFVEDENREDLLRTADFLQLHRFRDSIAKYYEENLDENTFYATKKLATTYHCTDLDEKCDTFGTENFEAIAQLEQYKNLTQEYVAFLLESTLNKTSATNKVKALMNWVRHDAFGTRKSLLPAMLAKLQLSEVSVQYKQYLLDEEQLTTESLSCIKLLCKSMLSVPTTVSIHTSEKQSDSIVVFDDTSRSLQSYCPDEDSWTELCALHDDFRLDQFTAVSLKKEIFVMMKNRTVYKLSQSDREYSWIQMANTLGYHGGFPPAVSDDNFMYVVGCWLGSTNFQTIEKFDPTLNYWTRLTDRNIKRSSTPVMLNGSIYCIGGQENIQCDRGQTEKIHFKTVEVFDIGSKEWDIAAPLLRARCHCAGIAYSAKIFVIGGWCEKVMPNAECYDPVSNAWSSLTPMLKCRQAPQVVLIGDEIFAVGGYKHFPSTVEKYSIEENKWSVIEIPEKKNLKVIWSVGILRDQVVEAIKNLEQEQSDED